MAFRTVSSSLRLRRRMEKQWGYYQRGMRGAKAFLSFYSPPKPRALLPIRLVDTARDVNEMQRGIRLASHFICVCVCEYKRCSLWLLLRVYHSLSHLLFCLQVPSFLSVSIHWTLSLSELPVQSCHTHHPMYLLLPACSLSLPSVSGGALGSYLLRHPTFQCCRGSLPASTVTAIPWVHTIPQMRERQKSGIGWHGEKAAQRRGECTRVMVWCV